MSWPKCSSADLSEILSSSHFRWPHWFVWHLRPTGPRQEYDSDFMIKDRNIHEYRYEQISMNIGTNKSLWYKGKSNDDIYSHTSSSVQELNLSLLLTQTVWSWVSAIQDKIVATVGTGRSNSSRFSANITVWGTS